MNQARIRTCTRDPLLRLLFVGLALILRNVWVWLHLMCLGVDHHSRIELRLERLRFRRMLVAPTLRGKGARLPRLHRSGTSDAALTCVTLSEKGETWNY